MPARPSRGAAWAPLALCGGAASAIYAVRLGQDVNSDQLNYHFYAAYALLHGRIDIDAAPAQIIHSYFNPLGYLPFYLLLRLAGPIAASIGLATLQALAWPLVAWIALRQGLGGVRLVAALVISAASPMVLSELGTSFIDVLTALPTLVAVALLCRAGAPRFATWVVCGGLIGVATGLKLTNATFAVGLLAVCLADGPGWPARLRAMIASGIGLAAGFLASSGWWCLMLWRRFGNPVFPYYNNIFRSPDFPRTSDIDHRYLPSGFWDGMAYPFRWMFGIVPQPEIGFSDIRFAVIAVVLALCLALRRRFAGPANRLLVFFVVSFAVWLAVFAIQRYLVTLELLCGPVAVVSLTVMVGAHDRHWIAAAVLAIASAATVVVPNWRHVPFLPGQYALAVPPPLTDDGLFLVAGEPISYVVPLLSKQARFFGIMEWEDTAATAGTTITRRIAGAIEQAGARPIRVLANEPLSWQTRVRLGSYGVQPSGACVTIPGFSYHGENAACALARTGDRRPALMVLEPGAEVRFGADGADYVALAGEPDTTWQMPGPIGDVTNDHRPSLMFRRSERLVGDIGVELRYGLIGATYGPDTLTPDLNGTGMTRTALAFDPAAQTWTWRGCGQAPDAGHEGLIDLAMRSRGRMIMRLISLRVLSCR